MCIYVLIYIFLILEGKKVDSIRVLCKDFLKPKECFLSITYFDGSVVKYVQ